MTIHRETITWPAIREEEVLARITGAETKVTGTLSSYLGVAPVVSVSIDPERGLTQNQEIYRTGIIVAKITKDVGGGEAESGKWGPYAPAATDDGRDAQACAFYEVGAANAKIRFTALRPGPVGRGISVTLTDPGGTSALAVTVTDQLDGTQDIDVSLQTAGAGVISTVAEVVAAVNAHADASQLVQAANGVGGDGTGVLLAATIVFLAGDRHGVEIGVIPVDTSVEFGDVAAAIYLGGAVFRLDKLLGYAGNEANLDAILNNQGCLVEAMTEVTP